MPVTFNAGTGRYDQDYARSTVVVMPGIAQDASPGLRLGTANGGQERAGAGDAFSGASMSLPISPAIAPTASDSLVNLSVDGEAVRSYDM